MQAIKLWKIDNNQPNPINKTSLDFEKRLQEWIKNDISIISDNLIIVGIEVETAYGGRIDILAMNQSGELVVIELKREKTYREVVAQAIDYATWVKTLNYEEINHIFLKKHSDIHSDISELSDYFSEKFNQEVEEFNTDHKILIVGSEIDDATRRIIEYLSSEPYFININALTFNYFKDDKDSEYLAQSFLLPEEIITKESSSKKLKKSPSIVKVLFEHNNLEIGQRMIFKPAQDKGGENQSLFTAIIQNTKTNCLKRDNDSQCYSFSKLRKIIADELNLADVKKHWGFGVRYEWTTEEGKTLDELFNEISSNSR